MSLKERIEEVEARIRQACMRSGRSQDEIHVVAVTKYVTAEETAAVLNAGFQHIGENRISVAGPKWDELGGQGTWHFIGHLQTNKVREVIGKFEYIHSLDRVSLAKELEKRAAQANKVIKVFVQVNVSGEESKQGLTPGDVPAFLKAISEMKHLEVIGLMTMAPFEAEPGATRPVFRRLRELKDELNRLAISDRALTELSMGMSNDFEVAIEEGATWVRLGSLLVGKGESS